ncbi:MAG: hypothetical protein NTZ26_11690 [Candidatus Aminicenantes bacterium]|nr:hypothetical protein [Candidatus Aminicenantes bacterium]
MAKMVLAALMGLVLLATGNSCRKGGDAAADGKAGQAAESYFRIGPQDELSGRVGGKVVLEGRLAKTPWQHMIHWPEGTTEMAYFDYELGRQTVLYAKAPVVCPGFLTVWGTVVEVKGETKRPGSDAPAVEYHILVEKLECAK